MTSFSSLLQSIGGSKQDQSPAAASRPAANAPPRSNRPAINSKDPVATNGTSRLAPDNSAAGVKRKSEDYPAAAPHAKIVRTEVKVPARPPVQGAVSVRPALSDSASVGPYRGTARSSLPSSISQSPVATNKPVSNKPASNKPTLNKPAAPSSSTVAIPTDGTASKPKRGFSSILEKAKAAQEAAKAAGVNTIKHKPVEKLTKRDRLKMQEEAKQKSATKGGKAGMQGRSRSGTPSEGKAGLQKKVPDSGYKGTMKKAAAQPQVSYKGTMKRSEPGAAPNKPAAKKGIGQDRYGGYASWSDLDDAEEDEEEYDSEGSDDMDAGFDDMQREETLALQAARKEDLEAQLEEERHKREKEERKRKLLELSKNAAARKRF